MPAGSPSPSRPGPQAERGTVLAPCPAQPVPPASPGGFGAGSEGLKPQGPACVLIATTSVPENRNIVSFSRKLADAKRMGKRRRMEFAEPPRLAIRRKKSGVFFHLTPLRIYFECVTGGNYTDWHHERLITAFGGKTSEKSHCVFHLIC